MSYQKLPYRAYGISDPKRRRIENPTIRDFVEFEKYSSETGGEYFQVQVIVQPGGGVPLHLHASYAERMTPIEGKLGLQLGLGAEAKQLLIGPGESELIARSAWHRFYNPSETDECVFRVRCEPAHQGFEILLAVGYGMAEDGLALPNGVPKNPFDMMWLLAMSDMTMPGLGMKFVMMLAGFALMIAEWTGRKDRLIRKYYGQLIKDEDAKAK